MVWYYPWIIMFRRGYNMQYNRKEQGIVADYVIIMGYDEHFAGSPEAGSVSSYNYVKEGISETLKEVPANKVISGIPFFTRLWEVRAKTEDELAQDAGTANEEYTNKVTSKALGMDSAQAVVKEAGVKTTWDDETKQNSQAGLPEIRLTASGWKMRSLWSTSFSS